MLELVVERLRLVAVDVINNLAHGIVNSFRSVGDVVVGHVRPGVPETKFFLQAVVLMLLSFALMPLFCPLLRLSSVCRVVIAADNILRHRACICVEHLIEGGELRLADCLFFSKHLTDAVAQPLEVYVEGMGNLCKVIIRKLNFARQTLVKV